MKFFWYSGESKYHSSMDQSVKGSGTSTTTGIDEYTYR